jgi:hypothetical protein
MFSTRRVPVALATVLAPLLALSVAGAAAKTTGSTTTTQPSTHIAGGTVPTSTTTIPPNAPGPAFGLPTDFGFQLVQQQNEAKVAMAAAKKALPAAEKQAKSAKKSDVAAQKQLRELDARARKTEKKLSDTRAHLRIAAAQAYMHAGQADLLLALDQLASASSAVDVERKIHLITTYGSNEKQALEEFLRLKALVDRQTLVISEVRDRTGRALKHASEHLADLKKTITDSAKKIAETTAGIEKFQTEATSAASPILGPSRLSANQMAAYLDSIHARPRITTSTLDLAQYYLDEGQRTGVRGDVAFAQSILETGGFANPGASADENNFAGIGWCDSCAHGFNFPTAQIGVRAQLQLLRIYVDPNFPTADYKDPILMNGTLSLGFRGKVQTWWDLWGTWATGALYGQRVYDIYEKMVAFSAFVKPEPRVEPKPTLDPNAKNAPPTTIGYWNGDQGPGTKKP